MTITSTSVVNEALMLMGGNQQAVTGVAPNFDSSDPGKAAALLYAPAVAAITRQQTWDFARTWVSLSTTGNTAPYEYTYEYLYPNACDQLIQVAVASGAASPNNPRPANWNVGNAVVSGVVQKVIWTNVANAMAFYSSSAPLENLWDPLFHQAAVRLLSSALAMALAGKPDAARSLIESAEQFGAVGATRDS